VPPLVPDDDRSLAPDCATPAGLLASPPDLRASWQINPSGTETQDFRDRIRAPFTNGSAHLRCHSSLFTAQIAATIFCTAMARARDRNTNPIPLCRDRDV